MKPTLLLAFLALGGTLGAQTAKPQCPYPDMDACPQGPTVRVQLTNGTRTWYEPLPVTHRTADRAFWIWTAASLALTIADTENSLYALRSQGAAEANPIFGAHPSRGRYYAIMLPVFGLEGYFSFRYKRESDALRAAGIADHKWRKWWVPQALNGGAHLVGIVTTLGATGR